MTTIAQPASAGENTYEPTENERIYIEAVIGETFRAAGPRVSTRGLIDGYALFVERYRCTCRGKLGAPCYICMVQVAIFPAAAFLFQTAKADRARAERGEKAWPGQPVAIVAPKLRGAELRVALVHAVVIWRLREYGVITTSSDTPTIRALATMTRERILAGRPRRTRRQSSETTNVKDCRA